MIDVLNMAMPSALFLLGAVAVYMMGWCHGVVYQIDKEIDRIDREVARLKEALGR